MAFVLADRVKQTSATAGTGAYALSATAAQGYVRFRDKLASGDKTLYLATDGISWEKGVGTLTTGSPDSLARTTVLESWNGATGTLGTSAIAWGSGTRDVFVGLSADRAVFRDDANQVRGLQAGSASAPGLPFDGDLDTGIAQIGGADTVSIAAGGVERVRIGSGGVVSIGGAPGAESLRVVPVASAINFLYAAGATTGNRPTIAVAGSDANVDMVLASQGGGSLLFCTNAAASIQFEVAHVNSADRRVVISGSNGGNCTINTSAGGLVLFPADIYFNNIGTTASSANALVDGGNFNRLLRSTSSRRYKTDIAYFGDDADMLVEARRVVAALRPVAYRSKASADRPEDWHYGLVAEDVAAVDEWLVHWSPERDAAGKPIAGQWAPDGVMYDRLGVLNLLAIQDLERRLSMLEAHP